MPGFSLFLIGTACHLPELELNWIAPGWGCRLGKGWEFHLYHSRAELSHIFEFLSNVFGNFSGCFREGILSGHDVIDEGLDIRAFSFELGFAVGAAAVLVASALI